MTQVAMNPVPMTPVPNLHDLATMTAAQRARLLQRTETDLSGYEDKVRQIIDAVRAEGDEALARFARDFDKAPVQANEIAATEADFEYWRSGRLSAVLPLSTHSLCFRRLSYGGRARSSGTPLHIRAHGVRDH